MPKKKLRFAPYCRVSTVEQAAKGESLKTQKEIIKTAVKELGGIIPKDLWKYSGQEHSTPGEERLNFNKLLEDCYKDKFDAIIVADFDRTGRDLSNYASMVDVLKETGIQFYVRTEKTDWHDPTQKLSKDIQSAVAEFHGMLTAKKSFENRVAKAKRGVPVCGNIPLGSTRKTIRQPIIDMTKGTRRLAGYKGGLPPLRCRKYDFDKEVWVEDAETEANREILRQAAQRYLEKGSLKETADWIKAQGRSMSVATLNKAFNSGCGDTLHWSLASKKIKKKESGTMTMPRLLDDTTIDQIKKKMNYMRDHESRPRPKAEYLLGGSIKCGLCGCSLVSHSTGGLRRRYYRHDRHCTDGKKAPYGAISVEQMDKCVFHAVFDMIGDPSLLEKAIFDAVPNKNEVEQLKSRRKQLTNIKSKLNEKYDRLIDLAADGLLPRDKIKAKSQQLDTELEKCKSEIRSIDLKLANLPTEKDMGRTHQLLKRIIQNIGRSPDHRDEMSFTEQKELLSAFFNGLDNEGRKLGCYVFPKAKGKFAVEIIGKVASPKGEINFVTDVISCFIDT